ncbi:MAG: flippase activity-associated protein Agl23 [Haloarculaceae archaeon]
MAPPGDPDDDPAESDEGTAEEPTDRPDDAGATSDSVGTATSDDEGFLSAVDGTVERGESLYERYLGDRDPVVVALAAVVAVGLLMRLVLLGARVAHFDEGRVAYWSLHYARTGSFAYRYIIHGPFLQHVARWLFPALGANDFTMRLPVALVGAALPGAVWLYREHLRPSEMVATALLLALNPVLLYFSRFMRSDLLVAAFMFTALGLLVRFYDTRRPRYLYATAAFVALAFGAKENAVVYLLTWTGATALLVEHALFRPREYDTGFALVAAKVREIRARGRRAIARTTAYYAADIFGALLLAGAIVLFLYAPRGAGIDGLRYPPAPASGGQVGLWQAVFHPGKLGTVVNTTIGDIGEGLSYWFGHTGGPQCSETTVAGIDVTGVLGAVGIHVGAITGYPCVLGRFLQVLLTAAVPLTAFAIFGTVVERYARSVSRNVVMFTAYTGFVSLLGYPLGTDIFGPWLLVHVLVPLSIPAGVGLAKVYRWGRDAFVDDDAPTVGITTLLLALVVFQMLVVSAGAVYANSAGGDNSLVQYAQPSNDLRGPIQEMDRIASTHDGSPDVLVYGEELTVGPDHRQVLDTRPYCIDWYNPMLPLPWYLYKDDVAVSCERTRGDFVDRLRTDPPPVVITAGDDESVPTLALENNYSSVTVQLRRGARERTFWFREDLQSGT